MAGEISHITDSNLGTYIELTRVPENVAINPIQAIYPNPLVYAGGPIFYEIIDGPVPSELILNKQSGEFSGIINEMDDYISGFIRLEEYNTENYATSGSASLYANNRNTLYVCNILIRAYDSTNINIFEDKLYNLYLVNNWSSDRDDFILKIKEQDFVLDSERVSNKAYLLGMKDKGYFNN